jgi:hypothetical protein
MRRVVALAVVGALALASVSMASGVNPSLQSAVKYVRAKCGTTAEPNTSMWTSGTEFNAIYGNCKAGDGTDQHIWFFVRGRFVGIDSHTPRKSIIGLWRDDKTLAFMYVLYRSSDPNCCPTGGGKIVRFRWNSKRVVALDRLPHP